MHHELQPKRGPRTDPEWRQHESYGQTFSAYSPNLGCFLFLFVHDIFRSDRDRGVACSLPQRFRIHDILGVLGSVLHRWRDNESLVESVLLRPRSSSLSSSCAWVVTQLDDTMIGCSAPLHCTANHLRDPFSHYPGTSECSILEK
jgi:hypothetical protein